MPCLALSAPSSMPRLPGEDCDPRDRRGRCHPLGCILLAALCAVVAGARCLEAIGQWAANAPQPTLARLHARTTSPALGLRQAPSPATIRRVLTALDPAVLLGLSAVEHTAVLIVDGKSLRGSATPESGPAHLLAAMTAEGSTAAQVRVGDKTSEIAALGDLLGGLDTAGCVVSADALHTQTATAEYLAGRGADYLLTVKANQPTLFRQAKKLPWAQAPVLDRGRERAHGREEVRTAKVLTVAGIAFPYAAQVVRIHRWVRIIATGRARRTYAYLVTSLSAERAAAEELARLVRGHWRIEVRHEALRYRTGVKDPCRPAVAAAG
ncbi:putative transposase YbfD/YdcC [Streptomonospora salina]|uniref:Putative transposase YbfD/YdcC n=3 Tax=Streptomonospora salina TaxID=104205 RepID=A0A841EAF7_9ACTN|nr:ISAs1 family transposase [Streptomonospora salina]MBB5999986.1 putative transposase YbfD/YdcC [Streptomonospora salina]